MALVLDATVGGANANSYETVVEAQTYMDGRIAVAEWDDADLQAALLVMATRQMDVMFAQSPNRILMRPANQSAYYLTARQWTGAPASDTQALAWPRTGMKDRLGRDIPSNVIPIELKNAVAEFAAQLAKADRTLDNDVIVQGLTSVKAGSVSLSFKDAIEAQVIPDAVLNMLPGWWYTDEIIEPAMPAQFDVMTSSCRYRVYVP